jgi:cyanate lyase
VLDELRNIQSRKLSTAVTQVIPASLVSVHTVAPDCAAGLTQADLATQLGEYQSFVARLESGQRRLDVVEFLEIAEVFGFDPAKAISALKKVS